VQTLLNRLISAIRGWLGWSADTPEDRMTPAHGWLLPLAVPARRRAASAFDVAGQRPKP
jgi:hypothetical protein